MLMPFHAEESIFSVAGVELDVEDSVRRFPNSMLRGGHEIRSRKTSSGGASSSAIE